jgi:hypothetical protein
MIPVGGTEQEVEEIYTLLLKAAVGKQPISAIYNGLPRLLCPHVLGRSREGRPRALCLQSGGGSESGLLTGPDGVVGWRCIAVEKLSQAALAAGEWRTEPIASRPTCVARIDFEVDAQPGGDPQNGQ